GERSDRIVGQDERRSRGPVDQPRELETGEVGGGELVEELLPRAGGLEALEVDLEIGATPLPRERGDAPLDRLAGFEAPACALDRACRRPVSCIRDDQRPQRRGRRPLERAFEREGSSVPLEDLRSARWVVQRLPELDSHDRRDLSGDENGQTGRITGRRVGEGLRSQSRL